MGLFRQWGRDVWIKQIVTWYNSMGRGQWGWEKNQRKPEENSYMDTVTKAQVGAIICSWSWGGKEAKSAKGIFWRRNTKEKIDCHLCRGVCQQWSGRGWCPVLPEPMSILCWNCRGRNRQIVQELRDLVRAQDPVVVFLAKTWLLEARLSGIKERLQMGEYFGVLKVTIGGGLALFGKRGLRLILNLPP